jgi:hypothetical protein
LKRGPGAANSPQDEKIYTIPRSIDEVDAVRKVLGLDRIVFYGAANLKQRECPRCPRTPVLDVSGLNTPEGED